MNTTDIELPNYSQPYLYERNGTINMLCCYAKKTISDQFNKRVYSIKPWKIHLIEDIKNNKIASKIDLPKYIKGYGYVLVECNPCVYSDNSLLTYTCGFKKNPQSAVYYYVVSIDAEYKNIKVLHRSFNGVLHNGLLYCTSSENRGKNIDIIDIVGERKIGTNQIIDNGSIIRISKIFDSNKFIVTYCSRKGNDSIILDENLKKEQNILNDLYKCSIYKNYLAYTTTEPYTENRSIKIIDNYC